MHSRHCARRAGMIAGISFLGLLVSALSAQVGESQGRGMGFPEDWTHHRLKFSMATLHQHPEIAVREPRAALQFYKEAAAMLKPRMTTFAPPEFRPASTGHPDWSMPLGTGRIQAGMYPAKWNSDPTQPIAPANCNTDFAIYGLNIPGATGGQASMIAFYNLYSGTIGSPLCSGGQPKVLFSYNTSTVANSQVRTSPVLSLDGKKVAFIETAINHPKSTTFHVLTIPAIGANGADATHSVAPPGGAMTSLTVVANSDTRSSPWIDYPSDTAYVAADDGRLYKIHPVFSGTPALVTTSPWPILIHLNSVLTSPVLDLNGNIYIGAGSGLLYTLNVNLSTPVVTSHAVGTNLTLNPGVNDSPLLDSGNSVFAFSSNDSTTNHSAVVVQMAISTLAEKARVSIGQGSTGGTSVALFDGDFDNNFTTPGAGHLYVCGTATATTIPAIYALPFNSSGNLTTGTSTNVATNAGTAARCGPVTEFFNQNVGGGTDFIFWSVTRNCISGANGCVMSLANGVAGPNSPGEGGGASGIIIDNNSLSGQASSICFSTETAPLNAVKLTQQNLN
jgi:hypothetical protein